MYFTVCLLYPKWIRHIYIIAQLLPTSSCVPRVLITRGLINNVMRLTSMQHLNTSIETLWCYIEKHIIWLDTILQLLMFGVDKSSKLTSLCSYWPHFQRVSKTATMQTDNLEEIMPNHKYVQDAQSILYFGITCADNKSMSASTMERRKWK